MWMREQCLMYHLTHFTHFITKFFQGFNCIDSNNTFFKKQTARTDALRWLVNITMPKTVQMAIILLYFGMWILSTFIKSFFEQLNVRNTNRKTTENIGSSTNTNADKCTNTKTATCKTWCNSTTVHRTTHNYQCSAHSKPGYAGNRKVNPVWIRQAMMGFWDGSGISWTICKQSAPHSRQTTTPIIHHSIFTGRMLFVMPNQQHQSTEGKTKWNKTKTNIHPSITKYTHTPV